MANPVWHPTHRTPDTGAYTWAAPQPGSPQQAPLEPHTEIMIAGAGPAGWTQVRCSNGWQTWVHSASVLPFSGHPVLPAPAATPRATTHPGFHGAAPLVTPSLSQPPAGGKGSLALARRWAWVT